MPLSKEIRKMLVELGNISEAELARRMGISPQNLSNKFKRDNFTEKDLESIADALNCCLRVSFVIKDTDEEEFLLR